MARTLQPDLRFAIECLIAGATLSGLVLLSDGGSFDVGQEADALASVGAMLPRVAFGGSVHGADVPGLRLASQGETITIAPGASRFEFAPIATGESYRITVEASPAGRVCSVANGSGTAGGTRIANPVVTCAARGYDIGGTISGSLGTGLVLTDGADDLALPNDAKAFTMPHRIATGASYAIRIAAQPFGRACRVLDGTGTMGSAPERHVRVDCAAGPFHLGGNVRGLTGEGLVLQNGLNVVEVTPREDHFALPGAVEYAGWYALRVAHQPDGQTCSISQGAGTMPAGDVDDIGITCSARAYRLDGTISGLTSSGLVLADGTDRLPIGAGAQAFALAGALAEGAPYAITIAAQPLAETCSLDQAAGRIDAATAPVSVICAPRGFSVSGTIQGLDAGGLVLSDGTHRIGIAAHAVAFTLPAPVTNGTPYAVRVAEQPAPLRCDVLSGEGIVRGGDIASVTVHCTPPPARTVVATRDDAAVAFDPRAQRAYVASGRRITSYAIDEAGTWHEQQGTATADATLAIALAPSGAQLYVLEAARLETFAIDGEGRFAPAGSVAMPLGYHGFVVTDPTGHTVYAATGSSDHAIHQFAADSQVGLAPLRQSTAPTGLDPHHAVVDPTGRYLYVPDAWGAIRSYRIERDGTLAALTTMTSLGHPNAVAVDPSGRFIYVSEMDEDVISTYGVGADGSLTAMGDRPTVRSPGTLTIDANGHTLIVVGARNGQIGRHALTSNGELASAVTVGGTNATVPALSLND